MARRKNVIPRSRPPRRVACYVTDNDGQEWASIPMVMIWLGVSRSTVYRMRRDGPVASASFGGGTFVHIGGMRQFMAACGYGDVGYPPRVTG